MEGVFIRNNSGTVICVFFVISNLEPTQTWALVLLFLALIVQNLGIKFIQT